MRGAVAVLLTALLCSSLLAQESGLAAWSNLKGLKPGDPVEVTTYSGKKLKGTFTGVGDDAITLDTARQSTAVPRLEVTRVRLRPRRHGTYMLVGAAVGGGAGVALGAGVGERFANESGGDFANLKGAITAGVAVTCALIGLGIGSIAGNRHTTVYQVR